QQDRDLQREDVLAVEILMQTVVIVRPVLEQQRSRPDLPGGMATGKKIGMFVGVPNVDAHCRIPPVGYRREPRVERRAQVGDDLGQWIREILVFAAPKSVPYHHHTTAKAILVGI